MGSNGGFFKTVLRGERYDKQATTHEDSSQKVAEEDPSLDVCPSTGMVGKRRARKAGLSYYANFVSDTVFAQDTISQENRSNSFEGKIHVSSMSDLCPRALFLHHKYMDTTMSPVDSNMRIVWAMGRAVEAHIRAQFIEAHGDICLGEWSCVCGVTKVRGFGKQSVHRCIKCHGECNTYNEMSLSSQEHYVIGNADLYLLVDGKIMPVEIKSMNSKDFEALEDPLANHCIQVTSYSKMLSLNGFEPHDTCVVIYANKDFKWGKNPYKEFPIHHADYMMTVDRLFDKSKLAATSIITDRIPDRIESCATIASSRAKKCDACSLCFSL